MKTLLYCALCCLFLMACNSQGEMQANNEGHSCTAKCVTSCSSKADREENDKFDFAMSSVCQASCGVSDYDDSDIVGIAEAKVGDITMCPVSGAIYMVKESSPVLKHNGDTFYSCCAGCADKFKEDPARFYKNV